MSNFRGRVEKGEADESSVEERSARRPETLEKGRYHDEVEPEIFCQITEKPEQGRLDIPGLASIGQIFWHAWIGEGEGKNGRAALSEFIYGPRRRNAQITCGCEATSGDRERGGRHGNGVIGAANRAFLRRRNAPASTGGGRTRFCVASALESHRKIQAHWPQEVSDGF